MKKFKFGRMEGFLVGVGFGRVKFLYGYRKGLSMLYLVVNFGCFIPVEVPRVNSIDIVAVGRLRQGVRKAVVLSNDVFQVKVMGKFIGLMGDIASKGRRRRRRRRR